MKRSLISTVLTLTLLASFDFSPAPAAELALEALTGSSLAAPAPPVETELIGRGFRGGGGGRRGGGGFRRGGGGGRRGGGGGFHRTSGGRSGGAHRTASAHRSGARRTTSANRGGARRSSAHAQTRHASSHSANSKSARSKNAHSQNSHTKNGQSRGGKNGGRNGGRNGRGGYWGGGGYWDGGAIFPVFITPDVVPVVPDVTPAVITLVNPEDIHTPVYYTLAGEQYVLQAGDEVSHGNETQVITFNRGGSFGDASYTLAPGTYRFVATDHGWDLHTVTAESATETTVASNDTETEETNSKTTTAAVTKDTNPLQWLSGR